MAHIKGLIIYLQELTELKAKFLSVQIPVYTLKKENDKIIGLDIKYSKESEEVIKEFDKLIYYVLQKIKNYESIQEIQTKDIRRNKR